MMLENINKINTLGCFHICAWMRGGQVASPPVVLAAALTYLLSASLVSLGRAPDPAVEGWARHGGLVSLTCRGEHPGAATV